LLLGKVAPYDLSAELTYPSISSSKRYSMNRHEQQTDKISEEDEGPNSALAELPPESKQTSSLRIHLQLAEENVLDHVASATETCLFTADSAKSGENDTSSPI